MAVAFPGPYVDQSLTERGPFNSTAAPAAVTNPRDLGLNRSYSSTRATTRTLDLSGQQTAPKPFPMTLMTAPELSPIMLMTAMPT